MKIGSEIMWYTGSILHKGYYKEDVITSETKTLWKTKEGQSFKKDRCGRDFEEFNLEKYNEYKKDYNIYCWKILIERNISSYINTLSYEEVRELWKNIKSRKSEDNE